MTRRERMERRAARRREWADGRRDKAGASFDASKSISDAIPFGQPILVGHHSERHARRDQDRIQSGMRKGVEHSAMAAHHEAKADGIEAQLDRSIYSDDHDAAERLRERIAEAEAARDRIKRYNATCRRGERDLSILDEAQKSDLLSLARVGMHRAEGSFPAYVLTNLGASIRRDRGRLLAVEMAGERAE